MRRLRNRSAFAKYVIERRIDAFFENNTTAERQKQ
jgi:hypothetical protein